MSEIIIGNNIVDTEVEDKKEEIAIQPKGKVVNCKLLNVRKRPKANAEILRVINEGDEVELMEFTNRHSDLPFYKVKLSDGLIGFCMTKYIKVK